MKTISPNQLSTLSGYTPQRIRQLQSDGVLPRSLARGQLPADKAIAALFSHLRGRLEKYSASRASSQNREQVAKASLAEICVHEKLGNLTPTPAFSFYVHDIATKIKMTLLNHPDVPNKVARNLLETFREIKFSAALDCSQRPKCPRCRIPIFADLDPIDEAFLTFVKEAKTK